MKIFEIIKSSSIPVLVVLCSIFAFAFYLDRLAIDASAQPHIIHIRQATTSGEGAPLDFDRLEATHSLDNLRYTGKIGEILNSLSKKDNVRLTELKQKIDAGELDRALPQVALALAQTQIKNSLNEEAMETLRPFESNQKGNADIFFSLSLLYQRLGQIETSAELLQRSLKLRPNHCPSALNLGMYSLGAHLVEPAIRTLKSAMSLCAGKLRLQAAYGLGISYRRVKSWKQALKVFEELINLHPSHIRARLQMASILRDEFSEYLRAEMLYQEVLRLDPNNAAAYLGLGVLRKKQGKGDEAIDLLQKATELNPTFRKASSELTIAYLDADKNQEGLSAALKLVQLHPDFGPGYYSLGKAYSREGQLDLAIKYYLKALDLLTERRHEVLNSLALAYRSQKNFTKAREVLRKAHSIAPNYVKVPYNLGLVYLDEGRLNAALDSFILATEINASYVPAWYNLGIVYSRTDEVRSSIAAYRKVLALEPNHLKARLNIAVQYTEIGKLREAVRNYRFATKQEPHYAAAWGNLALTLKNLSQHKDAQQAYLKAIELAPEEERYMMNLGVLYSVMGRSEDAVAWFEKAIELEPTEAKLRYNVGRQYNKLGMPTLAIKSFDEAIRLNPTYKKAWYALAETSVNARMLKRSLNVYHHIVKSIEPSDADARYEYAKLLYRADKRDEALVQINQSLKDDPGNAWGWFLKGKIFQAESNHTVAKKQFKRAGELNSTVKKLVARRLAGQANTVESLQEIQKEHPEDPKLNFRLAGKLIRRGDHKEALTLLQRVTAVEVNHAEAWIMTAKSYEALDDRDNAIEAYKEARKSRPLDGEIALTVGKLLYKMRKSRSALPHLEIAFQTLKDDPWPGIWFARSHRKQKNIEKAIEIFEKVTTAHPKNHVAFVGLGDIARRQKNFPRAIRHYEKALSIEPGNEATQKKLSRIKTNNTEPGKDKPEAPASR
jgi:tetratricopeptide (TPR) repeat protein